MTMTERVSRKQLEALIDELNRGSRGRYKLGGAYGGWKLEQTYTDTSGRSDVTYGYAPKKELYYNLLGILSYKRAEQRGKRLYKKRR